MCRGCYALQNNKSIGFNSYMHEKNEKNERSQHLTASKYSPKPYKK